MNVIPGTSIVDIQKFCKRASKLCLSQVIEGVTVKERLTIKHNARCTEFHIEIQFFSEEECLLEYDVQPAEILSVFGARFPSILKREIQLEMKKLDADLKSQIAQLGKGKVSKETVVSEEGADAEESGEGERPQRAANRDSEGEGEEEEDAKSARRKKEQASYESDGESDASGNDAPEAAQSSDEAEGEENEMSAAEAVPERATTLTEETKVVAKLFEKHFRQASSFEFLISSCSFKLEVSASSRIWA